MRMTFRLVCAGLATSLVVAGGAIAQTPAPAAKRPATSDGYLTVPAGPGLAPTIAPTEWGTTATTPSSAVPDASSVVTYSQTPSATGTAPGTGDAAGPEAGRAAACAPGAVMSSNGQPCPPVSKLPPP